MEEKEVEKKVWSSTDIINNRNNWTLASDAELLKHLESLSEVNILFQLCNIRNVIYRNVLMKIRTSFYQRGYVIIIKVLGYNYN